MSGQTPIRRQYLRIKQRYPQAILFFRMGDFYETFDEDAKVASRELEITLTSKPLGKGIRVPLAGIPHHALDHYLSKLINKGYKVAICEQLTDLKASKGLVERDVIRVVTPGTVVEPQLLEGKANNYLAALAIEGEEAGIAYADITTSEFATTQLLTKDVATELERLHPTEVLVGRSAELPETWNATSITPLDEENFEQETAQQTLLNHFGAASLEGYGCAHLPQAIRAAGAILHYLGETQKGSLEQITRLATYSTQSFMALDAQTRRNLELFQSARQSTVSGSLLSVIDLAKTAMGGRLLKRWLGQPLLDIAVLNLRQEAVDWFCTHTLERAQVMGLLPQIADLERLINRVRLGLAGPKELVALRHSLELVPQLKEQLSGENASALAWLVNQIHPCPDLVALIAAAIAENPPSSLAEGDAIKSGFSPELDQLRASVKEARHYLANLERQERERTEIKSLKVGYNKVFGYYIEVSKPHLAQVPSDYIRKQTLVGAERFFTPQLKEYESLILNARERMMELEGELFRQVCHQVAAAADQVLAVAGALAQIDVFAALAEVAMRYDYVRPQLTNDGAIVIEGGRHPVVEQALMEQRFVPNDTFLSNQDAQIIVLTGPNMSGKSTYLRQVALVVLLALIGSFVPARSARFGLVDRIFTRVGAQDDLAAGQSTFMVEMVETANILNNATAKSLIVLDEIGRGTSTYDGISIARAVAEYVHNHPQLGAKTLFATHYHELVDMSQVLPRVKNYNFAVAEEGGKVVFLRQIVPGGADKSYGIHVAQLAGLPRSVVQRAQEVLQDLEGDHRQDTPVPQRRRERPHQLSLFGTRPQWLEELGQLDVSAMTPLEAITKLYELQKKAQEERGL
ncbi:MAG: DNA mismatch repair protein MutS [Chloroflexi bacterium]|nr:DNA mismatch repair protein MutS [Chloroflexota bacterium]